MPDLRQRIAVFSELGKLILDCTTDRSPYSELHKIIFNAIEASLKHNQWFIPQHLHHALRAIGLMLKKSLLEKWLLQYEIPERTEKDTVNVGVIMAGNIPAVGFHDFLCVIMAGYKLTGKLSSDDPFLLPAFGEVLGKIDKSISSKISFSSESQLHTDIVIATGSNNTARYFDYHYSRLPHIFRKNRNGVAVLTGNESDDDLAKLSEDIFMHFGLGCRNVSKLYVPDGYNFDKILDAFKAKDYVLNHNPYMNNYRYNKALLRLQNIPFADNGQLLFIGSKSVPSPVATLHYEFYHNPENLKIELQYLQDQIQCIVSGSDLELPSISFGASQQPRADEFADGVDTMQFLIEQLI